MPILKWCLKYISHPMHLLLVHAVLLVVLDLYSHKLSEWDGDESENGEGKEIAKVINKIGKRVKSGTDLAQDAHSVIGMMEVLQAG